ncbi:hypothetical protein [Bradyrhizobium sp. MOS002]|uniref:hypothetical protein n=1 Tax=Bradyrhizobium sp. MOS002 TaxID=2133947 RepID=UPI000D11D64B|nr:hypothetical protein [Bradyrhizobium sp. MOS002]PSO29662.1 hypothetical protein C7G41_23120 [Bradyrhizobium sp. MOS002]
MLHAQRSRLGRPIIVDAARRLKTASFLIDGEAVVKREDGTPDFDALRSRRRRSDAVVLFAFDMLELHGDNPRDSLAKSRFRNS